VTRHKEKAMKTPENAQGKTLLSWLCGNAVWVALVGIGAAISLFLVLRFYLGMDVGKSGTLGDYFGGMLNPFLAFVALIVLVQTFRSQVHAFEKQVEETGLKSRQDVFYHFARQWQENRYSAKILDFRKVLEAEMEEKWNMVFDDKAFQNVQRQYEKRQNTDPGNINHLDVIAFFEFLETLALSHHYDKIDNDLSKQFFKAKIEVFLSLMQKIKLQSSDDKKEDETKPVLYFEKTAFAPLRKWLLESGASPSETQTDSN